MYLEGAIKCVQSCLAESGPPGEAGGEKHPLQSSQMCWEGAKVLGKLGLFFLDPGKSARPGGTGPVGSGKELGHHDLDFQLLKFLLHPSLCA